MAKILIVEDDIDYADMVRTWLAHERHQVEVANSGTQGMDYIRAYEYDLLILDWELPGLSGYDLCRDLRATGNRTPVIMLTGRHSVGEKEAGLDIGADDYLTKPVHVKELAARVRALLRRSTGAQSNTLKARDLVLDPKTHSVSRNGTEIELTPQEFAVLEFFMRHPNEVFSAEALIERVWTADSEASNNGVRACMTRLRHKIDTAGEDSLIRTVHGVGYRLVP